MDTTGSPSLPQRSRHTDHSPGSPITRRQNRSRSRSPLNRDTGASQSTSSRLDRNPMEIRLLSGQIESLKAQVNLHETKINSFDSGLRSLRTRVGRNEVRIERNEIIQRAANFRVKFVKCDQKASRATLLDLMQKILREGLKYTEDEITAFVNTIAKIHPAGANRFIVKLNCSETKRVLFTRKSNLKDFKLGETKSVSIEHDKTEIQMRRQEQSIDVCNRLRKTYPRENVKYRIKHVRGEEVYVISLTDNEGKTTDYELPKDVHTIPFGDV